jgi:hypothetical protein
MTQDQTPQATAEPLSDERIAEIWRSSVDNSTNFARDLLAEAAVLAQALQEPAPLADALANINSANELAKVESECHELRLILCRAVEALGTTAFCSSASSLEFLRHIPEEVHKTVEALRAQAPTAQGDKA